MALGINAVHTTVKNIQQTVVDDIKAASADGKISREEARRIKDNAIQQVLSYLGPKGCTELHGTLGLKDGAAESFIASKVEAAVHDLRRVAVGNGTEVKQ